MRPVSILESVAMGRKGQLAETKTGIDAETKKGEAYAVDTDFYVGTLRHRSGLLH